MFSFLSFTVLDLLKFAVCIQYVAVVWLPTDEKSNQILRINSFSGTRSGCFNLFLTDILTLVCAQVPDNYTPPAPITAPVMGFPVEAPQSHNHAQVPPGAPQEPSMQVSDQHWPFVSAYNSESLSKVHKCHFCVFPICSAPPAAADRESGAERNPCWTHDPQIHLWQFGSALPTSSKRSGKAFLNVFTN